jgi:hypothetical protein
VYFCEMAMSQITPSRKWISIKQSQFDMKYVFVKNYNEYLIQIAYRSPSIFLDGIYLTVPPEVIASTRLFHTHNHMQKIILIKTDANQDVKKWCELLLKINNSLRKAVCGDDSSGKENEYIEKLWLSDQHIAPPLKSNSRHELFKPFIKTHVIQKGEEIAMLVITNYNLVENHYTFPQQITVPIVFHIKEINRHYHNYYCRTSLDYKNL